jgi:hypothetical protein
MKMAASMSDIRGWFEEGVREGATHMIVVCDTFDHDDYPVFVKPGENIHEKENIYNGREMQRVMEVYNLSMDMGAQLNQRRAFNY